VKIKTSLFLTSLTVLLIVSAVVYAQQSAAPLTVNGHEIKGKVLEIDGKHFVAVEDLAQSLGGSLSYAGGIALTLPSPVSASPAPTQQTGTGRIKGTLTYFLNVDFGNRPETGSEVWLLEGHVEIPADQFFEGMAKPGVLISYVGKTRARIDKIPAHTEFKVFKHTEADGSGNFELVDIPVGEYTLIIQSRHTHISYTKSKRESSGCMNMRSVEITANETVDVPVNFRCPLPNRAENN